MLIGEHRDAEKMVTEVKETTEFTPGVVYKLLEDSELTLLEIILSFLFGAVIELFFNYI